MNPIDNQPEPDESKKIDPGKTTDLSLPEIANQLFTLQEVKNDGHGVSCVRSIVALLHGGQLEDAIATYVNEYDKIRSYPDIKEFLDNIWGDENPGLQFLRRLRQGEV